jgi:hypothetical protein
LVIPSAGLPRLLDARPEALIVRRLFVDAGRSLMRLSGIWV